MSFELISNEIKEIKPKLVYEPSNTDNISVTKYIETIILKKYSNKLLVTINELLTKLKESTLIPELGDRIDIILSENTVEDRLKYYENFNKGHNTVCLTPRTSFSSKKIWIPIDLLDYNREIIKNIDYINDIKLSNNITSRVVDSINSLGVKKDNINNILVSLNLGHEIGHYYFSKLFEEFNFTKCIYDKNITYKSNYKIWASLFTETFADKFSIQITDYINNIDFSQKIMEDIRAKDKIDFSFFIKNNHNITPYERAFSSDNMNLSVSKMLQDSLSEVNNIFITNGIGDFLVGSKMASELEAITKTISLKTSENKNSILSKIEQMRIKNTKSICSNPSVKI